MLYLNISQGYKGGSFPTVAMSSSAQAVPVKQEGLLSYEIGAKGTWLQNQLTVNAAFFYYDYKDKQILGAETDPIFGPLAELVNVPKSHVIGFEISGAWAPESISGLTITPSVSYQNSHIDNCTGTRVAAGAIGIASSGKTPATVLYAGLQTRLGATISTSRLVRRSAVTASEFMSSTCHRRITCSLLRA